MPTPKEFEKWLTTGQAASQLGRSRQGITWMLENRKLRGVKTQLGWLADPAAVERLRELEFVDKIEGPGNPSSTPDDPR